MLEGLYSHSVQLITVDSYKQVQNGVVVLDTRARGEYDVSHLKNARWVGYEAFQPSSVSDIPTDTPVVVHCSVGARSEEIGEKLQELGYQRVYNLYGGIFEWMNRGYPVYKNDSTPTHEIHPYSSSWGIWLQRGETVYE
jgi:rhodanese-related sulfurtransferase